MQAALDSSVAKTDKKSAYDVTAFHKRSNGQESEKENLPFLNEMGKGYRSPSALLGPKKNKKNPGIEFAKLPR